MLTKYYLPPWSLVHSTGAFSFQSPKSLQIPTLTHNFTTHSGTSHFLRHLRWLQRLIPSIDSAFFFPTLWMCSFLKHIFLGKICMSSLQVFQNSPEHNMPLKKVSHNWSNSFSADIHQEGSEICYFFQRWQSGGKGRRWWAGGPRCTTWE